MGTVQVEDLDDLEEKLSARIERVEEALGITPAAVNIRAASPGCGHGAPMTGRIDARLRDLTPRPWWRWQLLRLAHRLRWPSLAAWAAESLVLPHQDTL